MSLEKRKPTEPAIVLTVATIAFLVGLYLPAVSIRYFSITFLSYSGFQIIEATILFGLCALFSVLSTILYYFGNGRRSVVMSRNLTIIGILPGILGMYTLIFGQHQGQEMLKQLLLLEDPALDPDILNEAVGLLAPDFGLAIIFAGIIIMALGVYMINNYLKLESSNVKKSTRFPDLPQLNTSDDKLIESLKAMWYCPNDNNKLTNNVSRAVPNAEFRVSFDRLKDNINNAVATRKIKTDMVPYVTSLAEMLLEKGNKTDVELVSTICTICKEKFVSPKLSDWYNRSTG